MPSHSEQIRTFTVKKCQNTELKYLCTSKALVFVHDDKYQEVKLTEEQVKHCFKNLVAQERRLYCHSQPVFL